MTTSLTNGRGGGGCGAISCVAGRQTFVCSEGPGDPEKVTGSREGPRTQGRSQRRPQDLGKATGPREDQRTQGRPQESKESPQDPGKTTRPTIQDVPYWRDGGRVVEVPEWGDMRNTKLTTQMCSSLHNVLNVGRLERRRTSHTRLGWSIDVFVVCGWRDRRMMRVDGELDGWCV